MNLFQNLLEKLDKIPYENMWADDSHWLPRVLKGEKILGKFSFGEDEKVLEFTLNPLDE